ncbi:STAS/SEC14 domain-containing protein [uncultured Cytophaga sp.]|uniref:STAS/SEC14 domain-containing protein n=1 Tax=uncultured Cytophaga sp. TaxID=160238 RepID=UPI00261228A6|nr:STAS/SEC14 domain-containing protein [uncultured Cytophaga sp.]
MIIQIENLPANMVGFRAINEVTEEDYNRVVIPVVKGLISKTDTLNYLLILDTSVSNFVPNRLNSWTSLVA